MNKKNKAFFAFVICCVFFLILLKINNFLYNFYYVKNEGLSMTIDLNVFYQYLKTPYGFILTSLCFITLVGIFVSFLLYVIFSKKTKKK